MQKINLYTADAVFIKSLDIPSFPNGILPSVLVINGQMFAYDVFSMSYFECSFAVCYAKNDQMLMMHLQLPEIKPAAQSIVPIGDDSLLIGVPVSFDEAVDDLKTFFSSSDQAMIDKMKSMSEAEYVSFVDKEAGELVRDAYYLNWHEGHSNPKWPISCPPPVKYFRDLQIFHPHDMSSIILITYFRKMMGIPADIPGQVGVIKDHWRQMGFPDGICNPHKRHP